MTSADIELALTSYQGSPFHRRRWFVVPNVSWGWGLGYEADLICVNPGGHAVEVEIKVSRSDLRADAKKNKWAAWRPGNTEGAVFRRGTLDHRIWKFYYAVPQQLVADCLALEGGWPGAGILAVAADHTVTMVRRPMPITATRLVTPDELVKLGHLAAMRYWDQRLDNHRLRDEIQSLRSPPADA
jgi:hypothetical protein